MENILITEERIRQIIKEELALINILTTEEEITKAQNTRKTILEQASF